MKDLEFEIVVRKKCKLDHTVLELYKEENNDVELSLDNFLDWLEESFFQSEYTISETTEWGLDEEQLRNALEEDV